MASNWKNSDFDSFWRFYETAQKWPSQMENALQASTDYFYKHGYDQISTSLVEKEYLDLNDYYEPSEEDEEIEGHIMGDEKDWTPEMTEFVQKTREHRQQGK
jgi:hypothetical protein